MDVGYSRVSKDPPWNACHACIFFCLTSAQISQKALLLITLRMTAVVSFLAYRHCVPFLFYDSCVKRTRRGLRCLLPWVYLGYALAIVPRPSLPIAHRYVTGRGPDLNHILPGSIFRAYFFSSVFTAMKYSDYDMMISSSSEFDSEGGGTGEPNSQDFSWSKWTCSSNGDIIPLRIFWRRLGLSAPFPTVLPCAFTGLWWNMWGAQPSLFLRSFILPHRALFALCLAMLESKRALRCSLQEWHRRLFWLSELFGACSLPNHLPGACMFLPVMITLSLTEEIGRGRARPFLEPANSGSDLVSSSRLSLSLACAVAMAVLDTGASNIGPLMLKAISPFVGLAKAAVGLAVGIFPRDASTGFRNLRDRVLITFWTSSRSFSDISGG